MESECFPCIKYSACTMACLNPRKIGRKESGKHSKKDLQILPGFYLRQLGIKLGKTIGEGSYCKVKIALCYDRKNKSLSQKVACKVIDKNRASTDFIDKFLPRELNIICSIKHPHIVSVLYALELSDRVYIFMDLCEKGDLLEYVKVNGSLPESLAKRYFRQLVSAVEYLHSKDIAHRDLKCENILLTSKNNIKIGDFGFARLCRNAQTGTRVLSNTFCGSAAYAAPEVLQGVPYNPKMYDVWSLGCVLYIMLCASMPFDDTDIPTMLHIQKHHLIEFPNRIDQVLSTSCRNLIMHLLEPDITRRATILQISKSEWLKKYK